MSDEFDMASVQEEIYLAAALSRRHATLPAVGVCYSCAERVSEGRRFCDKDCLADWEKREAARRLKEGMR
jgi:hypothetical protein